MSNTVLCHMKTSYRRCHSSLLAELELTVVESSDTSISSMTDGEPPAPPTAAGCAPVDANSPVQRQPKPVLESSELRLQHGSISSGRPGPQPTHNGVSLNGHRDERSGSVVTPAAPPAALRDRTPRRQKSDPFPPDEQDQSEPSLMALPVAVRNAAPLSLLLCCWQARVRQHESPAWVRSVPVHELGAV